VASVPKEVMAGVEFEVAVTFVDRYGNPMAENWKPETSLTLNVSQPASVQPSILAPQNYLPGFTYSVRTEKMGELTLSLRNNKGKILDQWNLTIKSGRPAKLLLDLPSRAEVGETVTMSIQAVDAHGNVAFGYLPQAQSISFDNGVASIDGAIVSRAGGVYDIPIRFRSHGQQTVSLRDKKRALSGSSAPVNVAPAPLGSFDIITASGQSVAGKELALTIRALDRYGNPVTDYGNRYKGVRLYSGDAGVAPDLIPPSSFSDGAARVGIIMRTAGDHNIKVSELQSNISGEFSVRIVPAGVKTLRVSTPDSAMAGEPFEITITSLDEFGNLTPSIPAGYVVRLSSNGTGTVNPQTVAASSFKNGIANLSVSYEKAESFELTATLVNSDKAMPTLSPEDEKEKARVSAHKAREEAIRARRESRLRQNRVSKQVSSLSETRTREPAPADKKAIAPQRKNDPLAAAAPARQPSPVKEAVPVKTPESIAPGDASKKPLRPGLLDRIVVVEEESKALVTFSTNGMTDYNVTTSAKLSRKWIDIEFPDMAVDLPDRIGGGEKIVGEVYVEPSVGDGRGVRVSIEILPTRIGYDVYQEGHSIVLKVNKQ
jgi:S-adenosylmethionine hydrolase